MTLEIHLIFEIYIDRHRDTERYITNTQTHTQSGNKTKEKQKTKALKQLRYCSTIRMVSIAAIVCWFWLQNGKKEE